MAISKADVQKELDRLGQNRQASDTDVKNATERGIGIFQSVYGGSGAVPGNKAAPVSPAQVGQGAPVSAPGGTPTLESLKMQEQQAIAQEAEIGSQAAIVQKLGRAMLEARKQGAGIEKKVSQQKGELAGISLGDYDGLSLSDSVLAMNRDIAQKQENLSYLQQQAQNEQAAIENARQDIIDSINSQIAAAGLRVDRIGQQKNFAFQEQQAAIANARARGGSGAKPKDERAAFLTEAQEIAGKLKSGDIEWGQGWNYLKQKYAVPDEYNYTIDDLLGGSVTKDEFGNPSYKGWATPNAFGITQGDPGEIK
jgi:hypothetical protein